MPARSPLVSECVVDFGAGSLWKDGGADVEARSITGLRSNAAGRVLRALAAGIILGAFTAGCVAQEPSLRLTPTTTLPRPTAAPATAAPPDTPAARSSLRGSVSVWTSWEAVNVAALSGLLQEFHEQHPRLQIRLTYYREAELRQAFQNAAVAGQGPTVLIGPSDWGPALYRDDLISEVSLRLLPEQRQALPERVWSQAASGGALLGMPVRLRGVVLYHNRSLAPQAAASLDELLMQAAAASTRHPADPVFDLGFEFSGAHLTACGGTLLRAGGGLAFDEATGVCWLNLLSRFREVGRPVFNSAADRATFLAGHSPWLIDTTEALPPIVQALGAENVAIDGWPATLEGGLRLSGYIRTDNAYLAARATQADLEASWALISLLISPDEQLRHAQAEGSWFLPVLQTVQPGEPLAAQAQDILFANTAMPIATNLAVYTVALERAVVSVVGQAGDPADSLRRATEIIYNELTQSPPGG